jgi:hypothetical protein
MKVYILVVENHGSSDGPFMLQVYATKEVAYAAARGYAEAEERRLIKDHNFPIVTEHEVLTEAGNGEVEYNWGQFR